MVKLSNKGKGKPSKRKTLKTKYKIERKVTQHKKKMRKEMKKMGQKGVKPRKNEKDNMLPNSFPFKAQILQHYKDQKAVPETTECVPQVAAEWGLVAVEGRSVYFPKDKDHLTKKTITNSDKIWEYANVIVQTVDARNVEKCLSSEFEQECQKRGVKLITVVCKIDTVPEKFLPKIKKTLGTRTFALLTTEPQRKNACVEEILSKISEAGEGKKNVLVVGKANTGKHTLIKQFMKLAKFHNEDYSTVNDVKIKDNIFMLDSPYKIEDNSDYPLFHVPSTLKQESQGVQEEKILKYLTQSLSPKDLNDFIIHYGVGSFTSIDDLLKKIGKASRVFGKGGMVNVAAVRTTIVTDWYHGKLNYIFE